MELDHSYISDEGLKYLANIHTLILQNNFPSKCNILQIKITDLGMQYLSGIHTLILGYGCNISNIGLSYL